MQREKKERRAHAMTNNDHYVTLNLMNLSMLKNTNISMSFAWQDGGFQGTLNHTNDQSFILQYCK